MYRIIIVVLLVNYINITFCQETIESNLLLLEREIFAEQNKVNKQKLILSKIDLLITNGIIDQSTFKEVKRIQSDLLSLDDLKTFLWNASLISYLNNEIYHSVHYLKRYSKSDTNSILNIEFKLLSFLSYKDFDTLISTEIKTDLIFHDTIFRNLTCFEEVEEFQIRNKKLKVNTSFFVPGLGATLNGNVLKGFISLGLNSGTALAIIYLLQQNLYINSIFWGSNLIGKFYLGGVRMTEKLVLKKENIQKNKLAEDCELKISSILLKYPLEFK